ncbi:MAG: hypothetical protein HQ525_07845 [Anaerolineae bacterium]|nr:hypothetical protein [Anaerolineae bacterium]
MAKTFDLTLLPLYRHGGDELPSPPGLLVLTPPRRKARSREKDRLIVHLTLSGNASFSTVNYLQMTSRTAEEFYQTPGSVTAALRAAATTLNGDLLERNMTSSGQGLYTLGHLVLGALRGEQFYILESGPTHVYWMAGTERKDIHDPLMAGRGLGLGQATKFYLSQLTLRTGGRLLIAAKIQPSWEKILQRDNRSASLEAVRNLMMTESTEDGAAVLVEVQPGRGEMTVLKPARSASPTPESISKKIAEEPQVESTPIASHRPEPQRIPPSPGIDPIAAPRKDSVSKPPGVLVIPDSIPRQAPKPAPTPDKMASPPVEHFVEIKDDASPVEPPVGEIFAREGARTLARGMQATREGNTRLKNAVRTMMPRLLPGSDSETPVHLPGWIMGLIAVIIPLVVVTIASIVYFRFGRDVQYETLFAEADAARARAVSQDDPVAERIAWEDALAKLNLAEERNITSESKGLRDEAQTSLDALLGIIRGDFQPAGSGVPRGIEITAMAAIDTEIFLLDSVNGEILRAFLLDSGYQYDENFICGRGEYGGKSVGVLVGLKALPKANAMAASVLGIDDRGNLLYCAANQVPQALSLQEPPVGFKEITAISLDSEVLYILDALSREVWVYGGQASTFINYPTAFFENAPSGLENAVDISVDGSDLYLLFADGHLASCTYSLLDTVPTRCINPATLIDTHPAAGGGDSFGQAHFTQMHLSTPPDSALLLLDPKSQAVFRLSPRSFELQNKIYPRSDHEGPISSVALTAMTTNSAHVLFIAQGGKIYQAGDVP